MVNLFMERVHAWNRWCYFTVCWVAEDNVWFKPTRVTHRGNKRKQNSGHWGPNGLSRNDKDWGELSNEFVLCVHEMKMKPNLFIQEYASWIIYMDLTMESKLLWSGSEMWSRRFCTGPLPVKAAWM